MTWGIFWIFTQHFKSPKYNFDGLRFCPKYLRFELKKYRAVIFHDTEQWRKVWIKLSLEQSKIEKLNIDELFLSKVYNLSAKKFQRSYVSWHLRVTQSLQKNWLVAAWKMISGIQLIFMRAIKSENLHFGGLF